MDKKDNTYLLVGGTAFVLLFVMLGGVVARMIVLVGTVILLSYFIVKFVALLRQKKEQVPHSAGKESDIEEKIDYCETQIGVNRGEVKAIQREIRELENDLEGTYPLNTENRTETEKLLAGFRKELNLREVKIDFFRTCTRKLRTLLHNHRLTEKLFAKKRRLQKLQDKNVEDIAEMESIKSDMTYESNYLSTINRLSLRMYRTESVRDAEEVHEELKIITRELKEL